MTAFRILLAVMFAAIVSYTAVTIADHGWNLFPIFFGDIAAMAWPGQFNFDFAGFLILSALWVAWRHEFSPAGLALALPAATGGILFLSAYLLIASFSAQGDARVLLLGRNRAARSP